MLSVIIPAQQRGGLYRQLPEMLSPLTFAAGRGAGRRDHRRLNGCTDATAVAVNRLSCRPRPRVAADRSRPAQGDKLRALNAGERAARGSILAYGIDADIAVGFPPVPGPSCVSGTEPAGKPASCQRWPTTGSRAGSRSWSAATYAPASGCACPSLTGCGAEWWCSQLNAARTRAWGEDPQDRTGRHFTRLPQFIRR